MCHALPLVPVARGHGKCARPTRPVRQEQMHDKSLDTTKEKLEEFMNGPWPAFQKFVKSLDSPRASVEVAWVSGQRTFQKLFRYEMLLFES